MAGTLASRVIAVAGFCAGFALTAAVLRPFAERLHVPQVTEGLDFLAADRDEFDTLFVGSSRIRRQVSPRVFDARMRALGHPTHSLNLGIDAMTFPELSYFFDQILAARPSGISRVIFDVNPIRRKIDPGNDEHSLRAIYWHDWEHTAQACEALWHDYGVAPLAVAERMRVFGLHLRMFAVRGSLIGRGTPGLQRRLYAAPAEASAADMGPEGDGFFPVAGSMDGPAAAEYLRFQRSLPPPDARPVHRDPLHDRALRELAAKVRRAGARPIFLISPTPAKTRPSVPRGVTVLEFDDPAAVPTLFAAENRYDANHLNTAGALRYSAMVAEALVTAPESAE